MPPTQTPDVPDQTTLATTTEDSGFQPTEPSPVDPGSDACRVQAFDAITEINGMMHFFKSG